MARVRTNRSADPNQVVTSSRTGKSLVWALGGAILGTITTLALIVGNITTIFNGIQQIFPQIGPFDASISISDLRVVGGPVAKEKSFDGQPSERSVELHIAFAEYITGKSKLSECYSEMMLGQGTYRSTTEPVDRPADSQNWLEETFVVPASRYGGQATIARQCVRRLALSKAFDLPPFVPDEPPPVDSAPQQTSYVVCIGEHREICGGSATWLSCGSVASDWARSAHPTECRKVSERKLSDFGGNRCGYATFAVTCTQ